MQVIRLEGKVGNRQMNHVAIRTSEHFPTLHISWDLPLWKFTYLETFFNRPLDSLTSIVRVYKTDNKPPYKYVSYLQKRINMDEKEIDVEVEDNEQYIVELLFTDNECFLPIEKSIIISMQNKTKSNTPTLNWITNEKSSNWRNNFSTYTYYNISNEDD